MPIRDKSLEPLHEDQPAIPMETIPGVPGLDQPDPVGMMDTLLAVGTPFEEAFGQVVMAVGAVGIPALEGGWMDFLTHRKDEGSAIKMLSKVGHLAPGTANAWLNQAFEQKLFATQTQPKVTLYLNECDWITSLPDNLKIMGTLDLRECTSLRALPNGMWVGNELRLDGCTSLTEVPTDLYVKKDISFTHCSSLKSLPENFKCRGVLHLQNCRSLESLPEGLKVDGRTNCYDCTSLKSLPTVFKIGGTLDITNTAITQLPDGLEVKGSLILSGTPIRTLPAELKVQGDLQAFRCAELEGMGEDANIQGDVDLRNSALKCLPSKLFIGKTLDLRGCLQWDGVVPRMVRWGGKIHTDDTYGGVEFEDWRASHPVDHVNADRVLKWATDPQRESVNKAFESRYESAEFQAAQWIAWMEGQLGCRFSELQAMARERLSQDSKPMEP